MIWKTVKHIGFGFVLGMAVGNLIAALIGHPEIVSQALLEKAGSLSAALFIQTLLSGVIGGVAWAGISFYEIESWSLLRAVALHYASIILVFMPLAFYLGWLEGPQDALVMAGIMLAAHTMVFLIMCAVYRAEVQELNRLNELRKKEKNQEIGGII